jgi:prepilin-type N-terminal cleavage/methylation domain-containing protein
MRNCRYLERSEEISERRGLSPPGQARRLADPHSFRTLLAGDRPRTIGGRSAFTLVELLVVIAIIAVLVSLTAGGIFKAIEGQEKANTEQTIRKVMGTLKQQWGFVVDQARKEIPPQGVYLLANNDPQRAQVIWVKLRLKQEFPTTFQEARTPYLNPDGTEVIVVVNNVQLKILRDLKNNPLLPGRYTTALNNVGPGGNTEAAACLFLALSRERGGVKLNMDDLGSTVVRDTNGDGVKEIVDAWGTPLRFYRFPVDVPAFDGKVFNGELDAHNPAASGSLAFKNRDPLDPDGLLLKNFPAANQPVFQKILHPVRNVYITPVIVSAGPDKVFSNTNDDDIFSFRLRTGAKGD